MDFAGPQGQRPGRMQHAHLIGQFVMRLEIAVELGAVALFDDAVALFDDKDLGDARKRSRHVLRPRRCDQAGSDEARRDALGARPRDRLRRTPRC